MKHIIVIPLMSLFFLTGCTLICKTETIKEVENKTVLNTQYTLFGLSTKDMTSPGIPGMLIPIYSSEKIIVDESASTPSESTTAEPEKTNNSANQRVEPTVKTPVD